MGTALTSIDGIGEKTAEDLIKAFKSVKRVKEADPEQLEQVIGKAKTKILLEWIESNK